MPGEGPILKRILEKHGIYYGWAMVILALVVMAVCFGISHNCFTLYIIPVTEKFGWQRKTFSIGLTLMYIMQMAGSVLTGRIYRKLKVLGIMKIAVLIQPAAYFLLSFARHLPVFYLLFIIIGACCPFLCFQAFTVIIANWFEEKRGLVTGIAFMGSGLGGMIFNALGGVLIEKMGYAAVYRIYGIVIAAVAIPIVWFLLKEKPADCGLLPYGEKPGADGRFFHEQIYGSSWAEALRSKNLYLLLYSALAIGFATSVLSSSIVTNVSDCGYTATYAALVNAVYLGGVSLGKILLGEMFDRLGMKKALVIALVMLGVGLAGMYFASLRAMHLMIVIGASVGCAAGTVAFPLMTQAVFGNRDYTALAGLLMAVGNLGGCIAPFFGNAVFDTTGSYRMAYLAAGIVTALTVLSSLVVKTMKKPET